MKILAIVGSLRKESFNMQLANTIKERHQSSFELNIANIGDLPHFDQDQELDPPDAVKEFKREVAEADGILIITPEYNWSIPGVLKNALDWLSRVDHVLKGKPVMTAGVSAGLMGTLRAQLHIRQILSSPGIQAKVLPPAENELVINLANTKFKEGKLIDEATIERIDSVLDRFINFTLERN
jgi:chromate reductase, NAD(P)H dehydrogenase (quinone)